MMGRIKDLDVTIMNYNYTTGGVGWTALVVTGLLILLVIIVQVGKRFYGW